MQWVKPWNYEGRFNKPNGVTIWFSGTSVPRKEGEFIIFYGVLMDITRRKKMEQALTESERRLDLALSGANVGIWDWRIYEDVLYLDSRYYTTGI